MTSGRPDEAPLLVQLDATLHRLFTADQALAGSLGIAANTSTPASPAISLEVRLTNNSSPPPVGSCAAHEVEPVREQKQTDELNFALALTPLTWLAPAPTQPALNQQLFGDRYRCYDVELWFGGTRIANDTIRSVDGQPIFRDQLYLFNVIVALEWAPSPSTLQQLVASFKDASDFLYDATDGQMAFGQVVFGGMELMAGADIQVMASNRLHPRSWVNALNQPDKYMPIRMGRGLWSKNNSIVIPWNEPEGYRTIIHEWGHYALNLLDEYLEETKTKLVKTNSGRLLDEEQLKEHKQLVVSPSPPLVVPIISLASESIMATLEGTSEIVPQQHREDAAGSQAIVARLCEWYPGVDFTGIVNQGPPGLPLQLPRFYATPAVSGAGAGEEQLIDVDDVSLDHCWVYIVRWKSDVQGAKVLDRIIAQGSIDDRARQQRDPSKSGQQSDRKLPGAGFNLFGYQDGDELLFIGNVEDGNKQLEVRWGKLVANNAGKTAQWRVQLDPAVTPASIPVVTVVPKTVPDLAAGETNTARIVDIKVRIVGDQLPDQIWICPLGRPPATSLGDPHTWAGFGAGKISAESSALELDGQVLMCWNDRKQILIADYSQGGGPTSNIKRRAAPITAGSSEGNAMLFFAETEPTATQEQKKLEYSKIRLVTTRNYAGFDKANQNPGAPRSYLFSMASTKTIPAEELDPTLVLHFDEHALSEAQQLAIFSYDEAGEAWSNVPTYEPTTAFFTAIPLEKKDGKNPFNPQGPNSGIAHYRLFLAPKEP